MMEPETGTAKEMETKLDGNAAGGVLQEIFPFEMTMSMATCANCGAANPIGAVAAYMHGMGTVLRCPSCEHSLMRVAHVQGRYWLDMRGLRILQINETTA
jgi:Family of unknown function (DUF6510)